MTAGAQRMATEQPPQRKAQTPENSVGHDGLARVFGTGWSEAATRRIKWRNQILIQGNAEYHCFAHAQDSGHGSTEASDAEAIRFIKGASPARTCPRPRV